MLVDFIHFAAMYAILMVALRLAQAQFAGTNIGSVLAILG